MGKVRVKTIGIEEDEKTEKKKAKERAEAKRVEAAKKLGQETKAETAKRQAVEEKGVKEEPKATEETKDSSDKEEKAENKEVKKVKKEKFAKKGKLRSKTYIDSAKLVDKNKKYTLKEALNLLKTIKKAKFDEAVELHINTNEKGVSGSLTLPHGTGKQMKVAIADHAKDPKKLEDLIKKIEGGQVDFDILIATPDSMSHLARVARFLGPRGLMPNPKNGTVHPKPEEAAKKFEGGQINFKTEAKAPIIHMTIGRLSFDEGKLEDNISAFIKAVQTKNIKNATLKSTMSPGIKIVI